MSLRAMSILNVILVLALIAISVGWWLDHRRQIKSQHELEEFIQMLLRERMDKEQSDLNSLSLEEQIDRKQKLLEEIGAQLNPLTASTFHLIKTGDNGEEVQEEVSFDQLPPEVQAELRKQESLIEKEMESFDSDGNSTPRQSRADGH